MTFLKNEAAAVPRRLKPELGGKLVSLRTNSRLNLRRVFNCSFIFSHKLEGFLKLSTGDSIYELKWMYYRHPYWRPFRLSVL